MDYESQLARWVAGDVWSGLSKAALAAGFTKATAHWMSLREIESPTEPEAPLLHVFAIGQDRPDAIDTVGALGDPDSSRLYGLVVAVPDQPSPLAGSLLYQGVERLTGSGVRAGMVEPALLHAVPEECERYAHRLLERLRIL